MVEHSSFNRERRVLEIFQLAGAFYDDGHFIYTSGRHGAEYVNKDAIYPKPLTVRELCMMIAVDYQETLIDVVVGPTIGGVILANNTAAALGELTGKEVLGIFAEKAQKGTFALTRGYADLVNGKKVLVVEDLLNTGGSVNAVINACKVNGAEVVGVGALANRGNVTSENFVGIPVKSLLSINLSSFTAEECPLCLADVPIDTRVGKGKEYLLSKGFKL